MIKDIMNYMDTITLKTTSSSKDSKKKIRKIFNMLKAEYLHYQSLGDKLSEADKSIVEHNIKRADFYLDKLSKDDGLDMLDAEERFLVSSGPVLVVLESKFGGKKYNV